MERVLFVLKYREDPDYAGNWGDKASPGQPLSSGLANSARFVCEMLTRKGVEAKLVHVVDNNAIHAEIVAFGATLVIIEAFWVVPSKFEELMAVCPTVRFVVRNHSEMAFLAGEGIGLEWTLAYLKQGVTVSCNSDRALSAVESLAQIANPQMLYPQLEGAVVLLPNYYPIDGASFVPHSVDVLGKEYVDIGCFGAIRPLKNHVLQAVAALNFANRVKKKLRFHINGQRIEMGGSPILKNLRAIFDGVPGHALIEHEWMPHPHFKTLLQKMDVVTQVSFSETFNIVAADAISQRVPLVTSAEIAWSDYRFWVDPTDMGAIADAIYRAYVEHITTGGLSGEASLQGLHKYNERSCEFWMSLVGDD